MICAPIDTKQNNDIHPVSSVFAMDSRDTLLLFFQMDKDGSYSTGLKSKLISLFHLHTCLCVLVLLGKNVLNLTLIVSAFDICQVLYHFLVIITIY